MRIDTAARRWRATVWFGCGTPLAPARSPMAKRVLVVDDQPILRDVQVLVLREAGYAATALAGAREALDRLPDLRPDLIVLDMTMPGMDGRQFLRQLRADEVWGRLPVILASGLTAEEMPPVTERDCDVLSKPFSDVALLSSVRRLIGDA
jgi:CheY-like chemotaxis protein